MGDIALTLGRMDIADEAYRNALRLQRESNDLNGQALIHLKLSRVYRQSSPKSAEQELSRASELAGIVADDMLYTRALFELGRLYYEQGRFTEAIEQLTLSAELFDTLGRPKAVARANLWLGRAYADNEKPNEAKVALDKAEKQLVDNLDPLSEDDAGLRTEIEQAFEQLNA